MREDILLAYSKYLEAKSRPKEDLVRLPIMRLWFSELNFSLKKTYPKKQGLLKYLLKNGELPDGI